MKVGRGIGRVIGKAVRERIRKVADEVRPSTRRRPAHLDDTLRNAADEARRKGVRPRQKQRGSGRRPGLAGRVRERMGAFYPDALDLLTDIEWSAIGTFARKHLDSLRGLPEPRRSAKRRHMTHIVKGYIAERMIPNLPRFAALRQELGKRLESLVKAGGRYADLDPTVHFVRDVFAKAPGKDQWLQLTDGVLVAFSKEVDKATGRPRRVVVLAVLEAKSPKNYPDLVEEGLGWRRLLDANPDWKKRARDPGPRSWLGQFGRDFERFAELRTRIGAWEFEPNDVMISRRKEVTRWVSVLPKDVSYGADELRHLAAQGFQVDQWNLPAFDRQLARAADEVLREAERPARTTAR